MNAKPFLKLLLPVAGVVLLLGTGVCGWLSFSKLSSSETAVYVCIDQDDDLDSVCMKLKRDGACGSLAGFHLLSKALGYGDRIRAGRYDVGSGKSALAVVRALRNGSQSPLRLTIPNVWTSDLLAKRLSDQLMGDSAEWSQALHDEALLQPYGVDAETVMCLFLPNTYEVYWSVTPQELLDRMQRESRTFWNEERMVLANEQGLTPQEVIVLASIVDKETANAGEMPRIAGMYLNRLRKGMKLQADPTVKRALGEFGLRRLLHVHLQCDNPYNTYRYDGLPPGPICLPSMQSIQAVLHAERHEYLYMCAKEDFSGTHNFASTYQEHLANARKYSRALDERGIR